MTDLLRVSSLSIAFDSPRGPVEVVDQVALTVAQGEAVALVGESGCGKSVTARALLRLLPEPPAHLSGPPDAIEILGQRVLTLSPSALRRLRGRDVGFVFQDPATALNPVYPVGEQVAERLRAHSGLSRRAAAAEAIALLAQVGLPAPEARARAYPHQLSGGMRQRVVIAIALATQPALVIADEPTTALDVTVQAQIMALLAQARQARAMGLLLITHDLGLVAQAVERVVVMYAGQVVESAPVKALFARPRHPYTAGLLKAAGHALEGGRLYAIPGTVPAPADFPKGCRFAARCALARPECQGPVPVVATPEGVVRCLFPLEAP